MIEAKGDWFVAALISDRRCSAKGQAARSPAGRRFSRTMTVSRVNYRRPYVQTRGNEDPRWFREEIIEPPSRLSTATSFELFSGVCTISASWKSRAPCASRNTSDRL